MFINTAVGLARELHEYRHLLWSLITKNLKGKYKSSYLGFAWHFITPAISIILFYVVFTSIMAREIDNYWLYLCVGMFPFTFFQENLISGSGCIVTNGSTIKKMYFPREIIIIAQIVSTFITFTIAYVAVIILMIIAGIPISLSSIIFLPLVLLLSILFATGCILAMSAVTVFVRDIQHLIQAFARVLFWVTPIFYMTSDLRGGFANFIWYNPLTYFIESYHNILYFGTAPLLSHLSVCFILSIIALVIGLFIFNKLKWKFAEEL